MNLNTDIELIEASDLQVDASVIDVSEVESQEDKEYLLAAGKEILTIEAKADFAIKKIVATIQGRANLEKGRVVYEMQRRFGTITEGGEKGANNTGGSLAKFYASVGLSPRTANNYSQAYRTTLKFSDLFDGIVEPSKVLAFSDAALRELGRLPESIQEQAFADVAAGEPALKVGEIIELAKQPEVKISKAEELLARARRRKECADERWEMVKADPSIEYRTPEYNAATNDQQNATKAVARLEQELADLKSAIHAERAKADEQAQIAEKLTRELDKLKFDDESQRQERIRRLSASLTVSVPQVLADLGKFFTEQDHYPEEVKKHLLEQATYLANYVGDNL